MSRQSEQLQAGLKRRINRIFLMGLAVLSVAFGWQTYLRVHQDSLDRALVDAAGKGDIKRTNTLLKEGANAGRWLSWDDVRPGSWAWLTMIVGRAPKYSGRQFSGLSSAISTLRNQDIFKHAGMTRADAKPLDVAKLLVSSTHVNLNDKRFRNEKGESALIMAIDHGDTELVLMMLDRRADPNARDWIKCTPICHAAMFGKTDIVKALLARGADPNCKDEVNRTVFEYAINRKTSIATLTALIDAGADINSLDQNVWTPLMMASRWGKPEAVELLIKRGANVNAVTPRGATALKWAQRLNRPEIVDMLIRAGAKS